MPRGGTRRRWQRRGFANSEDDVRKVPHDDTEHAAAELLVERGHASLVRATTTKRDGIPGEPVLVCTLRYAQMVIREHGIDPSAFGGR